jgi:redox-sensitive bicupin YhaK (pirin superfamily)
MTMNTRTQSVISEGKPLQVGNGFTAKAFREATFQGLMDPIVLVDHYTMTAPTFGAHPHAGLSAVSILLEDTVGRFRNRDSLGNDFDLEPGDLYWLKAGRGIIHDELPRDGATIHGLQVFVNLPKRDKKNRPESLHVKSSEMPRIVKSGVDVRVVLGHSNGVQGQQPPTLPMTILEGRLASESSISHQIDPGDHAWCYAISGSVELEITGDKWLVEEGQAIALSHSPNAAAASVTLSNPSKCDSRFILFNARPIKEAFVQKGPFVMSTEQEIEEVERAFAEGQLGELA